MENPAKRARVTGTSSSAPEIRVITTASQLQAAAISLGANAVIALDCEGERLSRHGVLSLLQLYSAIDHCVFLVDVIAPEIGLSAVEKFLGPLLSSTTVLKVMHDCRQDSDALFHHAKISLANVFDVQVGHSCVLRKNFESHPNYRASRPFVEAGMPIGFARLLKQYLQIEFSEKGSVRLDMESNERFWLQRPLTDEMIQYASKDVLYLLQIHEMMMERLGVKYMTLAMEASTKRLDEFRSNARGSLDYTEEFERKRNLLRDKLLAAGEIVVIDNNTQLESVQTTLNSAKVIALSCETALVEDESVLVLLQLMVPDKALYIIDLLAPELTPGSVTATLQPLLENTDAQYIIFNAATIGKLLYQQLGIRVTNLYDVAKAHIALLRQKYELHPRYNSSRPFQEPNGILLPKLIQTYAETPHTDAYRHVAANPCWWAQRPLTDMMRDYAMKDTLFLPAIQKNLDDQLQPKYQQLVRDQSAAAVTSVCQDSAAGAKMDVLDRYRLQTASTAEATEAQ